MITSRTEIRGADIARHYDDLDGYYREIWGQHVHHGLWRTGRETLAEAVDQLERFVADEAAIQPGERVCDIGCGYGATACVPARQRGAEVTGITISPAQQAAALHENGGAENPRFLVGDWLANDLPAASFDAAVAIESSEHMGDKDAFFAQAWRVLRPGGRLVVTTWLVRESPSPRERRWLLEPLCRETRMPQLGAESDYRQMAARAGFVIQRFQDVTQEIARTWPMIVGAFVRHLLRHPFSVFRFLDPRAGHAGFALTIARLCVGFRTGAMRYGVFTLAKPGA